MGLPKINIVFKSTAASAVLRGERGIVAIILKDNNENGFHEIVSNGDIPGDLSAESKEQINLALMGGQKPPVKVVAYVLPTDASDYSTAKTYLETVKWDYLVLPADAAATLVTDAANWVKSLRDTQGKKVKAVLPNSPSDHDGIINFTTTNIKVGATMYSTAQYCARIAGILAGTPLKVSATFQPLPEVADVPRLTKPQLDAAIDAGQLILFHDGEKVKIARAVNSLVTTTEDKGAAFKKIKIVDILDLIYLDIKKTAEDNYIGKYPNSYDNKVLLITAINEYFEQIEVDGLLDPGFSNSAFIDEAAQRSYLQGKGVNVSAMLPQQIKEANTDDKVFLTSSIKPLDAIEEIGLNITV